MLKKNNTRTDLVSSPQRGSSRSTDSRRKVGLLDSKRHLPRVRTEGLALNSEQTMVSSNSSDQGKQEIARRKDTARRHLMGTLYTKHSPVRRSFSFVAGERPPVHSIRFPRMTLKDSEERASRKACVIPRRKISVEKQSSIKHRLSNDASEWTSASISQTDATNKSFPDSQKISLPDIIMDFNLSASMLAANRDRRIEDIDSDDAKEENDGHIKVENMLISDLSNDEFLRKKRSRNKLCHGKHRPVTPGLLDSLSKMKLSSKTKTEQWISTLSQNRMYFYDNYRLDSPREKMAYPEWIYSDV
ncbi:hypothetical protein CHS0354_038097 [Potamilus streckersoni]|uniref:Uncharacterized protein n=1 Tax=Potamilus streckersoni TaxID=2493646 RepID=A0AAE0SJV9_9BIVA|nr:hypothetical protein CHS0354_038097 [Potamilus streckersoni]